MNQSVGITGTTRSRKFLWRRLCAQLPLLLFMLYPFYAGCRMDFESIYIRDENGDFRKTQKTKTIATTTPEDHVVCIHTVCGLETHREMVPLIWPAEYAAEQEIAKARAWNRKKLLIWSLICITLASHKILRINLDLPLPGPPKWSSLRVIAMVTLALAACVCIAKISAATMLDESGGRALVHSAERILGLDLSVATDLLILCIAAPLLEELLFRSGIQQTLVEFTTPWTAVLVSSAIFGLMHWNSAWHSGFTFLAGVWLGLSYQKTGRLIVPVFCHAAGNVAAALVLRSL